MAGDGKLRQQAVGTGLEDLLTPCAERLRPAEPNPPDDGPPLGVTFSGGGFRATLTALGVLGMLEDVGMLHRLRYASSVSGGSVTNARLATQWGSIRQGASVRDTVIAPIVDKVSSRSLKFKLITNVWRTLGPMNRTQVLARQFDKWWLKGAELEDLDPSVRWIINTANVNTGVRFGFERDVIGDYVVGTRSTEGTGIKVATAAAASAAVPGVFPRLSLPKEVMFPCQERAGRPELLDGGVYDNTGLEVLAGANHDDVFTVVVNVGGLLTIGRSGGLPVVGDLQRANSLLYRQSTALRTRTIVPMMKEFEDARSEGREPRGRARPGILFGLASNVPSLAKSGEFARAFAEHRTWKLDGKEEDLAFVPTVFDKLERGLCNALVYRGWWLTGASLAAYHPDLIDIASLEAPPHN